MALNSDTRENRCLIWPEHPASVQSRNIDEINIDELIVRNSQRAGGNYVTVSEARYLLEDIDDERHRARITTWLVEQRRLGNPWPKVTAAVIEEAKAARPLSAPERADRLLRFLVGETTRVGETVRFENPSTAQLIGMPEISDAGQTLRLSLAHSESTGPDEIDFLQHYLIRKEWIESYGPHRNGTGQFVVTVPGYEHIAEQEVNPSSDRVFVAMWFDDSMMDARENGIKPAIVNTGYAPVLIDEKPDVDKIDDEIIGEIRRSRFLVADFTYGDKGIRGGVYYEAGFALGLGLEVIRSCRADQIADLHFDVNHHYHIAWNTPEELREGLERRILALVGEGPNRENIPPRNAL